MGTDDRQMASPGVLAALQPSPASSWRSRATTPRPGRALAPARRESGEAEALAHIVLAWSARSSPRTIRRYKPSGSFGGEGDPHRTVSGGLVGAARRRGPRGRRTSPRRGPRKGMKGRDARSWHHIQSSTHEVRGADAARVIEKARHAIVNGLAFFDLVHMSEQANDRLCLPCQTLQVTSTQKQCGESRE